MPGDSTRSWQRILGIALLVAMVALAGCSGGGGDGGLAGSDGEDLGGTATAGGGASSGNAGDAGGGSDAKSFGSFYDDEGDRVVVRDATLRLRVDDFEEAFRNARATVRKHGGYVGDREQTGEGEYDEGYFVVHVPPEKFSTVRDAIAGLGTTLHENVRVEDFTREFQSTESRVAELKADERRLERALANASGDVEAIREQLQSVREQRREAQSRAGSLQRRARTSTITVELKEPAAHRPADNRETLAGFSDAFYDAFYGGLATVRFLVILVGYAIPLGFVALVGGFGGVAVLRGYRRLLAPHLPELGFGIGIGSASGDDPTGGPDLPRRRRDGRPRDARRRNRDDPGRDRSRDDPGRDRSRDDPGRDRSRDGRAPGGSEDRDGKTGDGSE